MSCRSMDFIYSSPLLLLLLFWDIFHMERAMKDDQNIDRFSVGFFIQKIKRPTLMTSFSLFLIKVKFIDDIQYMLAIASPYMCINVHWKIGSLLFLIDAQWINYWMTLNQCFLYWKCYLTQDKQARLYVNIVCKLSFVNCVSPCNRLALFS